ncbi:MAG TPA: FtsX-like permease family protein [Puia sp.]
MPGLSEARRQGYTWPGKPADLQTEVVATWTGYGVTKTLGITMAEGRDFSKDYPGDSLSYVIKTYEQMYKSEMQVSALVKYFGLLALVISCLGLFGMVAFSAERRTKEIGIRKVLGSSVRKNLLYFHNKIDGESFPPSPLLLVDIPFTDLTGPDQPHSLKLH